MSEEEPHFQSLVTRDTSSQDAIDRYLRACIPSFRADEAEALWQLFVAVCPVQERRVMAKWVDEEELAHFWTHDFMPSRIDKSEWSEQNAQWRLERSPCGRLLSTAMVMIEAAEAGGVECVEDKECGTSLHVNIRPYLQKQLERQYPHAVAFAKRFGYGGLTLGLHDSYGRSSPEIEPKIQAYLLECNKVGKSVGDPSETRALQTQSPGDMLSEDRFLKELESYDEAIEECMKGFLDEVRGMVVPQWQKKFPTRWSSHNRDGVSGYKTSFSLDGIDPEGETISAGQVFMASKPTGDVVIYAEPKLLHGRCDPTIKPASHSLPLNYFLTFFAERGLIKNVDPFLITHGGKA